MRAPRVRATLLAAFLLYTPLTACRDLDVVTAAYATLDEAVAAGAVANGWLPRGLPPGAREIREAHDLDSNRRWGLFVFPPEQAQALKAILGAEVSLEGRTCDPPRRIEWWPLLLRDRLDQAQIGATGHQAYESREDGLIFVVHWKQGRAYYCTGEQDLALTYPARGGASGRTAASAPPMGRTRRWGRG